MTLPKFDVYFLHVLADLVVVTLYGFYLQAEQKESGGGSGGGGGTGHSVSTLAKGDAEDSEVPDDEKTVFDWCKEGRVSKLESLVTDECVNSKDNQVSAFIKLT